MKIIILSPKSYDQAWLRALPSMRYEHAVRISNNILLISSEDLQIGWGDAMLTANPGEDSLQFSFSVACNWARDGFVPDIFKAAP